MASNHCEIQTICDKFTPTEFTIHLDDELQHRYTSKLSNLNITDPYRLPEALFTAVKDFDPDKLPDLQYPDIYNYLINFPSVFTGQSLRAYKSLESYRFRNSGFVNNPLLWHLPNKAFHLLIARVSRFCLSV